MPNLSVVVCVRTPRKEYLSRVMEGLRNQTVHKYDWELLLIGQTWSDFNPWASDISWHPNARYILDNNCGFSCMRGRAVREARSDLLVIVNEDNVLAPNYLSEAIRIGHEWPRLGIWGSGAISFDFEVEPADYMKKLVTELFGRDLKSPSWSNVSYCAEAMPPRPGLCVRAAVASTYSSMEDLDLLDVCGEEHAFAYAACAIGYGFGAFPELRQQVFLPKRCVV